MTASRKTSNLNNLEECVNFLETLVAKIQNELKIYDGIPEMDNIRTLVEKSLLLYERKVKCYDTITTKQQD